MGTHPRPLVLVAGLPMRHQQPIHIDVHIHGLTHLGAQMSALTDAVATFSSTLNTKLEEIAADVAHLQQLVEEAGGTSPEDQATIDRLTEEAAAHVAEAEAATTAITDATAVLAGVDADPSFPPADPNARRRG